MKTKLFSALCLLLLVFTTSCNFTESVVINEDGSGTMTVAIDGSQLMAMAGEEMAGETGGKRMDTVMDFKELLKEKKDSIAKLPEKDRKMLEALGNMKMKMLMDPNTSEFKLDMITDFKKISELQDLMKTLNEIQGMNKQAGAPAGMMDNKSQVHYSYDGRKFIRKVELPKDVAAAPDSLAMYVEMFETSNYVLSYKFPKKIKSVSNKSAVISDDKKTLTLAYSFSDYLTDPKSMNLEVEFEK